MLKILWYSNLQVQILSLTQDRVRIRTSKDSKVIFLWLFKALGAIKSTKEAERDAVGFLEHGTHSTFLQEILSPF